MKIVSAVIVIIFGPILFAQDKELDSLRNELTRAHQDTFRIELLNTLAYKLHTSNPKEGINYARESISLAKRTHFEKGLARAYNSLGACFWNQSKLDSALKYYQASYLINDRLGIVRGTTGALGNMAIIYNHRGDYVNAINTYTKALGVMRKEGLDSYVAITSNNLGLVLDKIGDYPQALKHFNEAIEIGEPLGMSNLVGPAWINIGNIYKDTREPKLELQAKKRALKIGYDSNDQYTIALALNNLGNLYERRKEYDSALSHFEQALKINEKVGRKAGVASNLNNIGLVHRWLGEYKKSEQYLKKGLEIAEEIGDTKRITRINYQLGETIRVSKSCKEAIPFYLKGLEVAEMSGNYSLTEEINKALYVCFLRLGDYENALNYHEQYTIVKDSILSEENIKGLAKVQAQYEFKSQLQAKNAEIQLLETREQLIRLRLFLFGGIVLLFIMIGFFVARSRVRSKAVQAQKLKEIGEFKQAMTGMVAHDLKNPLSVILNGDTVALSKEMAGRMLVLVNNMLDVQKFESAEVRLNVQVVEVSVLVDDVLKEIHPLLKRKNLSVGKCSRGQSL